MTERRSGLRFLGAGPDLDAEFAAALRTADEPGSHAAYLAWARAKSRAAVASGAALASLDLSHAAYAAQLRSASCR